MTTLAATGFSRKVDSYRAGVEAAAMALRQVENPDQILLFSSVVHDPNHVSEGVRSVIKGTSIMGGSSFGEITNHGMNHHSVVLMAIRSDDIDFRMVVGNGDPDSTPNGGELAAQSALKLVGKKGFADVTLAMFLSEMKGNEKTLQSLQKVFGLEHPLFGGCCSGNRYASIKDDDFVRGYQFVDDQIHNHSVPLLMLSGECKVVFGVAHGWRSYGKVENIGRCQNNVIYQIGDESAAKFYQRFLGNSSYTPYPLAFTEKGKLVLRAVTGTAEDGGLAFTTGIPTGTEVRITRGNRKDIIQSSRDAAQYALDQLGSRKPRFGIVVSCISRHMMLGSRVSQEIEAVQEVLGKDVPLIGFYAAGEYAPIEKRSFYHNLTFCICLVGDEQENAIISAAPKETKHSRHLDDITRVLLVSADSKLKEKCNEVLLPDTYKLICRESDSNLALDVRLGMPHVILLESPNEESLGMIRRIDPAAQVILLAGGESSASLAKALFSLQEKHYNLFGIGVVTKSLIELSVTIDSAARISRMADHFQTVQSELDEKKLQLQHAEDSIEATEMMLTESYNAVEDSKKEMEANVEQLNASCQYLEETLTQLQEVERAATEAKAESERNDD